MRFYFANAAHLNSEYLCGPNFKKIGDHHSIVKIHLSQAMFRQKTTIGPPTKDTLGTFTSATCHSS